MDPLGGGRGALALMPTYRSRAARATIHAKEAEQVRELERKQKEALGKEERALRTRLEVADVLEKEQAAAAAAAKRGRAMLGGEGRPDDSDRPEDEQAALEAWKLRELRRLVRDRLSTLGLSEADFRSEAGAGDGGGAAAAASSLARGGDAGLRRVNKGAFYVDEDSLLGANDVRLRVATKEEIAAATYQDTRILPLHHATVPAASVAIGSALMGSALHPPSKPPPPPPPPPPRP
jgi:Microfibril-associated/Pre-mRNA processing